MPSVIIVSFCILGFCLPFYMIVYVTFQKYKVYLHAPVEIAH